MGRQERQSHVLLIAQGTAAMPKYDEGFDNRDAWAKPITCDESA